MLEIDLWFGRAGLISVCFPLSLRSNLLHFFPFSGANSLTKACYLMKGPAMGSDGILTSGFIPQKISPDTKLMKKTLWLESQPSLKEQKEKGLVLGSFVDGLALFFLLHQFPSGLACFSSDWDVKETFLTVKTAALKHESNIKCSSGKEKRGGKRQGAAPLALVRWRAGRAPWGTQGEDSLSDR